jgi:hypothetical protein
MFKTAFRILRPGARLFIDIVDLESDAGWAAFANAAKVLRNTEPPPYFPKPSISTELSTYAVRAGYEQSRCHRRSPLIIMTAIKPPALAE